MSPPLLKPRWLVGHVLVVAVTIGFTLLGFWQLDRHFEQRVDNAALEERIAAVPVGLEQVVAPPDAEFRRVTVTGRYDYAAQLELRPRVRGGQAGYEQIVPFRTGTDTVLVNRGFIAEAAGSARQIPGRTEELQVTGTVRLDQGTSRLGPQNPAEGVLETIFRIDLDRLRPQFDGVLADVYLDLIAEAPPAGGIATVLPPPPEPTSRPHLLYSLQWWAFAAIASIGWIAYLRKQFFT